MTLDEILASLFPDGHAIRITGNLIGGTASLADGKPIHVIGIKDGAFLGIEDAAALAGQILKVVEIAPARPILVLIDSASQRMSRRDELLGLSEYLAHLAKTLLLAEARGHRTVGLLYGGSAAGAFIATALATGTLAALPGAHPAVMDLPSMSRVTKLPLAVLEEKAKATPVFAPGLDNLAQTGAVHAFWDPAKPLAGQLAALLAESQPNDTRDRLGAERGGRPKAAEIAARVIQLAGRA